VASISHQPTGFMAERSPPRWTAELFVPEFWAAAAIVAMWLAVLFDSVYGHDFVSTYAAGTQTTTIPSALFVALFACIATGAVARYGFGRGEKRRN
jgi:hypothetical protein